jgi:hypothetical protein
MSRLIADRDGTMPPRYAWNGQLTNVQVTKFKKAASGSYNNGGSGNASAACSSNHPAITGGEDW